MLTPVQTLEASFQNFNELIKQCPNGYPARFYIDNSYKYIKVIGITWRGSIKNPIPCFITKTGGLIDYEYYIIL